MAKYQIITSLDDRGFKQLRKSSGFGSDQKNLDILHNNLWSMFYIPFTRDELRDLDANQERERPAGSSVTDYGWTPAVRAAFLTHPYHASFVRRMQNSKYKHRRASWGMWCLNSEPVLVDEQGEPLHE